MIEGLDRRCAAAALTLVLVLAAGLPARAQDNDGDRFKAAIAAFLGRISTRTEGAIRWAGSDPIEIRRDGDALVAVVANGKLEFGSPTEATLTLDRIEIRRTAEKPGGKLIDFALALPKAAVLRAKDGSEAKLAIEDGQASAVVEADSDRVRDEAASFAGAHAEETKSGARIGFGPMSLTAKTVVEFGGGWRMPVDFELRRIELAIPQAGAAGTLDRVTYHATATGPQLAQLDKLRDAVAGLQGERDKPPEARLSALLAMVPGLPEVFSSLAGEAGIDGLKVHDPKGAPLVSLTHAGINGKLTGLDRDKAAIRLGLRCNGLALAPALMPEPKQPHRLVVDLGLVDLSTAALRDLLATAAKLPPAGGGAAAKPETSTELLAAAAKLDPTFRIYDVALDTDDAGVDLKGEIAGSPLTEKGYRAAGDLLVRGLDAGAALTAGTPLAAYLPILQQLGIPDPASGRAEFHLASTMTQPATINGNDVALWFAGPGLKPAMPPIRGPEVERVQQALAAAGLKVGQDGVYDAATAGAVAAFQKQHRLNVSGVVDAATRKRLGLPPDRQN